MTEQQLIAKLQELKNIKPSKNWVSLAKTNILQGGAERAVEPFYKTTFSAMFGFASQKKFAYGLASFLLIFAGVIGFLKFGLPQNFDAAKNSTASLLAENTLKSNVEDYKEKSQTLAQVSKDTSEPQTISSAIKQAKQAAQNLTNTIQQNPQLAKTVALEVNNNKTILDIPGGDNSSEVSDLQNSQNQLEKAVVEPLIKDEQKTSLTPDEKSALDIAVGEYDKADYGDALRDILLLQKSEGSTTDASGS